MKIILQILLVFVMLAWKTGIVDQEIDCNSFCVTNIQMDTLNPNYMSVTIFFNGHNDDFINYPHVSLVTNSEGDTLGVGNLNFFGQIGNTAQDYPVLTDLASIPEGFTANVHFKYDTSVCILPYPCPSTAITEAETFYRLSIHPNPFQHQTTISLDHDMKDLTLEVYNMEGKRVQQMKNITGPSFTFNRDGLPDGVYCFRFFHENTKADFSQIVIIN